MPLFRRGGPSWEPNWQTFPGRVDDIDVMLHADLGAVAAAPVEGLAVRLTVRVELAATRPDGSPRGETAHQLYELEDRLAAEVAKHASGRYVGRVVGGGECVFVCQLPGPPGSLKLGSGPLTPVLEHVDDPEWQYVRRAFTPDPAAAQRGYNKPLVAALVARGDRTDVPRPVQHSAHFAEQAAATAAGAQLADLGYQVSAVPGADGDVEMTATRALPLTEIDESSVAVLSVVRAQGGDYDGWGCDLVR